MKLHVFRAGWEGEGHISRDSLGKQGGERKMRSIGHLLNTFLKKMRFAFVGGGIRVKREG